MTREQAKELLPIIQAFAEGKTVQFLDGGKWADVYETDFHESPVKYRIKPEPKYRPFKTTEECWNEMLKHQPFGWIKNKITNSLYNVTNIYIKNKDIVTITTEDNVLTSSELLENYVFIDGISFGMKEE